MIEQLKICSKCSESKPLSEFGKDSRHIDGHRSECKACALNRSKAWREANKDKVNQRARERAKTDKGRAQSRARRARWRRRYPAEAKRQLEELKAKHPRK